MVSHLTKLNAFYVTEGCKKKAIVINTTTRFHLMSDFFHQISFHIRKIKKKNNVMITGNKHDMKLFIIYSEELKPLSFQSLIKQSKDKITSDPYPT